MPDVSASTIDELVRSHAADRGAIPMVIDPSTRISYGELDSTTHAMAAAFVEAGVGKGTRVGLIMPNGARWVQVAVALTRIGAVLVPLSTLLTARELVAQLRVASVQFLVTVEEFRGHRYLDDLRSELGSPDLGQELVHNPKLPALRRSLDGRPTGASQRGRGGRSRGRRDDQDGHPQRHAGRHVHLRQQRAAEGRCALPRQRVGRCAIGSCGSLHRLGYPPVSADAVLLGRRLRRRGAVGSAGRRHPGHRGNPATGSHSATAGKRAGHAVSWLAGSGRGPCTPIQLGRSRSVRVAAGHLERCLRPINRQNPVRAQSCSA